VTPVFLAQAREFFARALALDPGNVEAAVAAAQIDVSVASAFLTDDPSVQFEAAETALHKVLLHAPNHPRTHMLLGAVQMQTRRALSGIAECRQALLLDPNLADAHGFIGLGKFLLGRGEEVEEHVREALRLSPHDTRIYLWYMFVGLGKLSIAADSEAVDWFRWSIECNRNHALAHFHFATALALVGDVQEARAATLAGLALDPGFTIRRYRTKPRVNSPAHLRFYEGMRLAGVPEG
jgi:tetratricopeptide (TPR) repeat protein